ncbi:MAG: ABC transporter ATP-binding protein [Ruminococcaceae bacterium]|nr:ABC transporter ATP-binding protein [Oscillospiraceae bacterium]
MKKRKKGLLLRFIPYFKKYKWILFLDLFFASLTTVCELVLPLLVRLITDCASNSLESLTVQLILSVGLFYLVLRVIDALGSYYMADVGHVMGARIETDMRRDLFTHLSNLSFSYYDNAKIGSLMSRLTGDLFDITEFAHHCPEEFFISFLKITAAFCILCSVNVWLTFIIFSFLPFLFLVSLLLNRKMRKTFKESRVQVGELNAQIEDSLLGIRVVKSFANESVEIEKFKKGNEKFLKIKRLSYRYMALFQSSTRSFDGVMYVAVLVSGSLFMMNGHITSADLIAYLLYVNTLLTSIRRIVEFTEQFQRGMTGIERFCEVLDEPIQIRDKQGAIPLPKVQGYITFDHVSFRYAEGLTNVLTDINLSILPGESVALVGPSGGGKTTLCSLLPRFYDVTEGKITIDGHNVQDVTLKSLRTQIGVVQQDIYMFSGTVFDNIEYGMPGADMNAVVEAAKLAGAHEFITQLPEGYHTYVGERGVKLSGGQKQRIGIARVFLKNPPILILDEATSALDNESERLVQKSLESLAKGRTTFTIAHRLSTIRNARIILVLTEKGIEEQGSHEELMAAGGLYYHLYQAATEQEDATELS